MFNRFRRGSGRRAQGLRDVHETPSYQSLARGAHQRAEWDRRLRAAMPASLAEHCHLADLRQGRLVFLADSSAWATRVRVAQADILVAARALGLKVAGVSVRVEPKREEPKTREPHFTPLSDASARHLRKAAATCSDRTLRDLFLDIASTAEKRTPPNDADP